MSKDSLDLERIKHCLSKFPEVDIVVISNGKLQAEHFWKEIKRHLGITKRPIIVTNNINTMDGIPIHNSLALMVGNWWENKNAVEFMNYIKLAKLCLPITFIPPFTKGGEANGQNGNKGTDNGTD